MLSLQRQFQVTEEDLTSVLFLTFQSYVTFDGTNVNAGNGFDASTGVFKAPRSGLYNFAFHALTQDGRATYVKVLKVYILKRKK
jgi:hypothetical protein